MIVTAESESDLEAGEDGGNSRSAADRRVTLSVREGKQGIRGEVKKAFVRGCSST